MQRNLILILVGFLLFLLACTPPATPKPRAYFRIDFPKKQYQLYDSICPYRFEYPTYGVIESVQSSYAEPCWYNIDFPGFNTKIHLTYKPLHKNLATHIEDVRTIVYKHVIKADDIVEHLVWGPEKDVYGVIYMLEGNTASSAVFFLTDSVNHFLAGSLYISALPNKDSLAPSVEFFQEDVVHLTESLSWK